MSNQTLPDKYRDRFALSPAEAAHALGVSRKHIYTLMTRGELRSVLISTSRRIPITEVERLAGSPRSTQREPVRETRPRSGPRSKHSVRGKVYTAG